MDTVRHGLYVNKNNSQSFLSGFGHGMAQSFFGVPFGFGMPHCCVPCSCFTMSNYFVPQLPISTGYLYPNNYSYLPSYDTGPIPNFYSNNQTYIFEQPKMSENFFRISSPYIMERQQTPGLQFNYGPCGMTWGYKVIGNQESPPGGPEASDAKTMAEKWRKKYPNAETITKDFCQKVIDISKDICCKPEDLMAVMALETARTFSPFKQNSETDATGLIQFMPKTAASLLTSDEEAQNMSEDEQLKYIDQFKSMSAIEQLDYVKKYLIKQKGYCSLTGNIDKTQLYCLVFYPAALKSSDFKDYVIADRDSTNNASKTRYTQNSGLDKTGGADGGADGKIKPNEFATSLDAFYA